MGIMAVALYLVCTVLLEDPGRRRNLTTQSSSQVAQLVKELLVSSLSNAAEMTRWFAIVRGCVV